LTAALSLMSVTPLLMRKRYCVFVV